MASELDYAEKTTNAVSSPGWTSAGSLRWSWRYGDLMVSGFAQKSMVDLKRRLPQTHNCNEATG